MKKVTEALTTVRQAPTKIKRYLTEVGVEEYPEHDKIPFRNQLMLYRYYLRKRWKDPKLGADPNVKYFMGITYLRGSVNTIITLVDALPAAFLVGANEVPSGLVHLMNLAQKTSRYLLRWNKRFDFISPDTKLIRDQIMPEILEALGVIGIPVPSHAPITYVQWKFDRRRFWDGMAHIQQVFLGDSEIKSSTRDAYLKRNRDFDTKRGIGPNHPPRT